MVYTKEVYLYIDGTNLFAGQTELFGLKTYLSFSYLIKEVKKLFRVDKIFFYASYLNQNDFKIKELRVIEALFYKQVRSYPNLTFYKGHRSPTSGKEKGVDVHLAVDIVKDVLLGKCKEVIIITGDADFIYPIEISKHFNIKTGAVFLPNRFSLEIAYKVNRAYVFNLLGKFKIKRKLPKQLLV